MIEIVAVNRQSRQLDLAPLRKAARMIAEDHGVLSGEISIAVVDDDTIHDLNRRYLNHDYPTDVLSFLLESEGDRLEGEIVVSLDTAAAEAPDWNWSAENELLLYVIHGALHLVGHDDHEDEARAEMRKRESEYLGRFGLTPRPASPDSSPAMRGEGDEP